MGYQRAAQLLMLGDSFSAEEALQWGLVNAIFDADTYQEKAFDVAKRLAAQPAKSVRLTKALLRKGNTDLIASIIAEEGKHFGKMILGDEAKEAMQAFLDKRKPDFTQFD